MSHTSKLRRLESQIADLLHQREATADEKTAALVAENDKLRRKISLLENERDSLNRRMSKMELPRHESPPAAVDQASDAARLVERLDEDVVMALRLAVDPGDTMRDRESNQRTASYILRELADELENDADALKEKLDERDEERDAERMGDDDDDTPDTLSMSDAPLDDDDLADIDDIDDDGFTARDETGRY